MSNISVITIKRLFNAYKNIENYLPKEILDIVVGNKLYDKKYIEIRKFFINYITLKQRYQ